jgi:chemotaxis protein methyltransferase CheR
MKVLVEKIIAHMAEKYNFDISPYDESFLEKCINGRTNDLFIKEITDYSDFLYRNPAESSVLYETLNNSYSEFFRNPLTFIFLEQVILPQLFEFKTKTKQHNLRIWSAGCSAGQEPYSLAILVEDYKKVRSSEVSARIFATDKNEKILSVAKTGTYNHRFLQKTMLYFLDNYFSNSGDYYSINESVKKSVEFSVFDLLGDGSSVPPSSIYGDFDIVMCSNLLFYYKPDIQKIILLRLLNSMIEGGFLVTGEAEMGLIKSIRGFKQISQLVPVFIKI